VTAPNLWGKIPLKPPFGARIRIFKPNLLSKFKYFQNYRTYSNQILNSYKYHQILIAGGPNSKHTHNKCKMAEAPNLRPISIVTKRLDASRCHLYGGRPQPRPHCARWGPSSPPQKGAQPSNFRPMSIVGKWLDESTCHLVRR